MFKFNSKGVRINPSVQVATSTTQVFKQSLTLPEGDPKFDDNKVNNIYDDPLEHYYDPVEIAEKIDAEQHEQKSSQIAAENINPVKTE